nr:reverse transcriptase domain-containing protein [Tanacetum cinerariifolium]
KVERNNEGGRPFKEAPRGNGSQNVNLPPLFAAHIRRSENGGSFTSLPQGGHVTSTFTNGIKKEKAKSTDIPRGEGKKDKSIAPVEAPILMINREDCILKNTVSENMAYKEGITFPPVTRVSNAQIIIEAAVFGRKVGRVYMDSKSTCEDVTRGRTQLPCTRKAYISNGACSNKASKILSSSHDNGSHSENRVKEKEVSDPSNEWKLYTDGASSSDGAGAGLMLIDPAGKEYTYALPFEFETTNNEADYEALLAGLRIAQEMEITKVAIFLDSQLVVNQIKGAYAAKPLSIKSYLQKVAISLWAELNYTALEKLILALVHAARRLRRYFQAHTIMVLTADFLPEIPFDESDKRVKEKEVEATKTIQDCDKFKAQSAIRKVGMDGAITVEIRAKGNAIGNNGNQIGVTTTEDWIAQEEEARIQSTQEEFKFMATADAYEETERVKVNCTLEDTLQQSSTFGTQSDNAPIYDSDGSTKTILLGLPKDIYAAIDSYETA